jgi:hypothetical protein
LGAAAKHPELLLSLAVLEPPLEDLLDDPWETHLARDEWRKGFEAVRAAAQAGDAIQATRLFYELANDQAPALRTRNLNSSVRWSWTTQGPSRSLFPRGHLFSHAPHLVA